ncbi:MAG TPA: hypothetical protein VN700_19865 [Vicinamibacterales bacterium]|nr:hypothetical protein [Vicinamibacterales bacterium]
MSTLTAQTYRSPDLPMPASLEATGLRLDMIVQLLVKTLHMTGEATGTEWAERLGLPFTAIEPGVETLKAERLCEIVGGTSLGPLTYKYRISTLGRERAAIFLDRSLYVGIAPVPLDQYRRYMHSFDESVPKRVSRADVERGFSHLVLSKQMLERLGPAVNSGQSLFVYGPPGNGKTVISQAIRNILHGDIWIPHAIEVDGSIIQVFDPINHDAFPRPRASETFEATNLYDRRWERCRRPLVTVGGEMVLESLDLTYNQTSGIYRPSLQLMANGGVLVIDDFGRQRCSPVALLNRWVHPLESRVDYLVLQSGQKVEVPFLTLPVFATNIKPAELVDEAFLRRIQYKIRAENPTPDEYARIFEKACIERGIPYDPAHVRHLLDNVYTARGIPFRGCHPRDLISQALALGQYLGEAKALTVALLDAAVATYFIEGGDESVS